MIASLNNRKRKGGVSGDQEAVSIHLVVSNWEGWKTRGSVGWACVAHLSFCFEETLYRTCHRCLYLHHPKG